ncbi:MAG: TPM domain-containing protein [Bacteroidota bacterium]|nr:TPM domain-containing protein [Bacteroidota bacterium]
MRQILVTLFFLVLKLGAQNFPQQPLNYVTDNAAVLSSQQEELLNAKLKSFEDSTSTQIFVYLETSLNGKNLEEYSKTIFNTWGIGQKDKNNGVLIAVFIEDRKYRIQVGFGLEKVLSSELTKQIQDEEMRSFFRDKNYYGGIDVGVNKLIYYSKNEFKPRSKYYRLYVAAGVSYILNIIFFSINLLALRKWKNKPKQRKKNIVACLIFLPLPGLGTIVLMGLCSVIYDKKGRAYYDETDLEYERRMQRDRANSNSSSSDDSFSGGGGGSSDSGGSSSDW